MCWDMKPARRPSFDDMLDDLDNVAEELQPNYKTYLP